MKKNNLIGLFTRISCLIEDKTIKKNIGGVNIIVPEGTEFVVLSESKIKNYVSFAIKHKDISGIINIAKNGSTSLQGMSCRSMYDILCKKETDSYPLEIYISNFISVKIYFSEIEGSIKMSLYGLKTNMLIFSSFKLKKGSDLLFIDVIKIFSTVKW